MLLLVSPLSGFPLQHTAHLLTHTDLEEDNMESLVPSGVVRVACSASGGWKHLCCA